MAKMLTQFDVHKFVASAKIAWGPDFAAARHTQQAVPVGCLNVAGSMSFLFNAVAYAVQARVSDNMTCWHS